MFFEDPEDFLPAAGFRDDDFRAVFFRAVVCPDFVLEGVDFLPAFDFSCATLTLPYVLLTDCCNWDSAVEMYGSLVSTGGS